MECEVMVDVPGAPTGQPCGPSEEFSDPITTQGFTFQTWWCACGSGVNAQVEPDNLLSRYARQHLAAKPSQAETEGGR